MNDKDYTTATDESDKLDELDTTDDIFGELLTIEDEGIWSRIMTKRFIISNTMIWQYFVLVVYLIYTGTVSENKEILMVFAAGVGMILNYYMKSDAERHE